MSGAVAQGLQLDPAASPAQVSGFTLSLRLVAHDASKACPLVSGAVASACSWNPRPALLRWANLLMFLAAH